MSEIARRVYLILGAAGSGRREVVRDLIASGFEDDEQVGVITASTETNDWPAGTATTTWSWNADSTSLEGTWPNTASTGFFITDGRGNPVDQVEAVKPWLAAQAAALVRVACVVNCALCAEHTAVVAWHDACIHFSDIVLLNRREGVPNKWMSDYQARFAKNYLPCLVEFVKKGRVANPALVLDEQVRRLSHWFDEAEGDGGWQAFLDQAGDVVIEDETDPTDDAEDEAEVDEYLERNLGGTRRKKIPSIADYLPPVETA